MMMKTAAIIAAMLAAAGALQTVQTIYGENIPGTYESEIVFAKPTFEYIEQPDMTLKITGYSGSPEVNFPAVINGCAVAGVGSNAFYGKNIVKAIIPKGFTFIGNSSFRECKKLEYAELPETLTEIGAYAFCGCTSLKKIVIPESVSYIGDGTFAVNDEKTGELKARSDIVLYCAKGSYAESYAKKNGLHYQNEKDIGTDITITDTDTYTDTDKRETVTPQKPDKVVKKLMFGDADGDTFITSADALSALRISTGINKSTVELVKVCDIDTDGYITSADALDILRHSVGLKSSQKIGTWMS